MSRTLEPDTSLDLFDIDENDFEYENESVDNSFSRNLQALQAHSFGYPTFAPLYPQGQQEIFNQHAFVDPFHSNSTSVGLLGGHVLNGIAESVEHHFQATRQPSFQKPFYDDLRQNGHVFYPSVDRLQPQFNHGAPHAYPALPFLPIPQPSLMPLQPPIPMHHNPVRDRSFTSNCKAQYDPTFTPEPFNPDPKDCSVCLAPQPAALAILQPCRHPLCSSCLTSALNIVGEKDMECAVCKQSVANFNLVMGPGKVAANSKGPVEDTSSASTGEDPQENGRDRTDTSSKSFANPLFSSSPGSSNAFEDGSTSNGDLESAFEFGLDLGELRASTPKLEQQMQDSPWIWSKSHTSPCIARNGEDNVVLRIDNVPWVCFLVSLFVLQRTEF